jgi:protein disulfide-isomerase A1
MRVSTLSLSAAYLLSLAAFVVADEASDVISLKAADFEAAVAAEPLILVEFFAPWYLS